MLQYKYNEAHEKAKGHYLASTLVDYPEVIRSGDMEKMKNLVSYFLLVPCLRSKITVL